MKDDRTEIERLIRETLVVDNKTSIKYAADKIAKMYEGRLPVDITPPKRD